MAEPKKTTKTLGDSLSLSDKMKRGLIRSAERTKEAMKDTQDSADEYAAQQLEQISADTLEEGKHIVVDITKGTFHKVKETVKKEQPVKSGKSASASPQDSHQPARPSQKGYYRHPDAAKTTIKSPKQTYTVTANAVQQSTKTAGTSAQAAAKAATKTKLISQKMVKATAEAAKAAAKAVVETTKALISGVKELVATIAAGGWVSVIIIVVILFVALIAGSSYGIFFSSEDTGSDLSIRSVVWDINQDYQEQLTSIKESNDYDKMEVSGSRAVWPEVLSVYAVKVNTDADNPQEVVTMDDWKCNELERIFWNMNQIDHRLETTEEIVVTEQADPDGNIIVTESMEELTTLYIDISHKTASDMATKYRFTATQRELLEELIREENTKVWSSVLYGIHESDEQIVAVALSQVGNVGGRPYWSWYGFSERVEWCACFVSWCANECGYIEEGIVPQFAACGQGVRWFQEHGQWMDGTEEPLPGSLIFFDWDSPNGLSGPQDNDPDHVGIVEKVEDGYVYTIEGNISNSVVQRRFSVGNYQIMGYGLPSY